MPASAGPIIYLVDDDAAVRDSLRTVLEAYGMTVREYGSARLFLGDCDGTELGCLILDLHMPEMSGLELLEILRERESPLPVIVFTGRGDANLREQVARLGAVDLLAKPVDPDTLLQAIERALDAR